MVIDLEHLLVGAQQFILASVQGNQDHMCVTLHPDKLSLQQVRACSGYFWRYNSYTEDPVLYGQLTLQDHANTVNRIASRQSHEAFSHMQQAVT